MAPLSLHQAARGRPQLNRSGRKQTKIEWRATCWRKRSDTISISIRSTGTTVVMSSQLSQDSRPQLTQDTRIGEFKTPLGKDVLVLTRFDGVEGLAINRVDEWFGIQRIG